MKKILILIVFTSYLGYSQVGVGTTAPDSTLDIVATNPTGASTNVDGILIPRVDRQRAQSMTGTITSTMIYVNSIATGTASGTTVNMTSTGFYFYDGIAWQKITTGIGTDWELTGNSGTTAGTNFIGTTDAKDLRFKTGGNDKLNISDINGQLQSYTTTGSATTPSYSFSGTQTSTGMFNPAADNLGFSAGGTERFRIPNANQVHAMSIGTAALPFYSFSVDTNTGLFSSGADNLDLSTGGTARFRIPNANQVHALSIGTAALPFYSFSADPAIGMWSPTSSTLAFSTAGAERMRIDNVGKVGIGGTPTTTLDIVATNPTGATTNVDGILIPRVDRQRAQVMTGTSTGTLVYVNSIATGAAAGTAINITSIGFYFYDGSFWQKLATGVNNDWALTGNSGTTAGTNFVGTTDVQDLVFKTSAVVSTPLERVRVTTAGNVGINAPGPTATALLTINPNTNAIRSGIDMTLTNATSTATGLNITTANSLVNGITVTQNSGTNTSLYGIGGVLSTGNIVSGYNGYRTGSGLSYGIYGINGLNSLYATNASTWAGFLQGRTVISSEAAPTSALGTDLEVRNTTTGAAAPATVSLRQTTSLPTTGNVLANLNFGDNYVTTPQAQIQILRDAAASSAADMPTAMTFSTTPDASATLTERMRIESDGDVGIGTTPDISAKLDVSSTSKGFLAPRVALTTTNAAGPITTPATGLFVYNTATAGVSPNNVVPGYYYNSGTTAAPVWKRFSAGNGDGWQTTGNAGTGAANYVGTSDAVDFKLATNGTERMRVLSGTGQVIMPGTSTVPFGVDRFSVYNTAAGAATDSAINGYSASTGYGVYGSNTGGGYGTYGYNNSNGYGVYGYNNSTGFAVRGNNAGTGFGVYGSTLGSFATGTGVYGSANVASGYGVYGTTSGATATGVFGNATGNGSNGVYGQATAGTSGYGVYGYASTTVGDGVRGSSIAATGSGVYGTSNGTSGYGVYGIQNQSNRPGVYGVNDNATGNGVYGTSTGTAGYGVFGISSGTSGVGVYGSENQPGRYGVWGINNNATGIGVYGSTTGNGPAAYGVNGATTGSDATAVLGTSVGTNADGVTGIATGATGYGVWGINDNNTGNGVVGNSAGGIGNGVVGGATGTTGYGVLGTSTGTSGIGVYGSETQPARPGVYGVNDNATGNGVYGTSAGSSGNGVYGNASGATGFGVFGVNNNATGYAVVGSTTGSTGRALYGTTTGTSATAVYGSSSGADADGVYGQATGATGYGVWGVNDNATGNGVVGNSSGTNGRGIYGVATGSNGVGVVAEATTSSNSALSARNLDAAGTGVIASGNNAGNVYLASGSGGAFNGSSFGSVSWGRNTATGIGVAGSGNGEPITTLGTTGAGGAFTGTQWALTGVATITGAGNDATDRGVLIGNYVSGGSTIDNVYVGARIANVNYKILGTGGGSVATTMKTSQGERILFAPEATENWFFDMGEVELVNGKATVNLDPIFVETLSDSKPFKVFVQGGENTLGSIRITRNQNNKSFVVEDLGGASNGTVQYSVYGIWKGKENLRLPELKEEDKPKQVVVESRKLDNNLVVEKSKKTQAKMADKPKVVMSEYKIEPTKKSSLVANQEKRTITTNTETAKQTEPLERNNNYNEDASKPLPTAKEPEMDKTPEEKIVK